MLKKISKEEISKGDKVFYNNGKLKHNLKVTKIVRKKEFIDVEAKVLDKGKNFGVIALLVSSDFNDGHVYKNIDHISGFSPFD